MSKLMKIGEFSEKTGIPIVTLRHWDVRGRFKAAYVSEGGTRYYTEKQIKILQGEEEERELIIAVNTNIVLLSALMMSVNIKVKEALDNEIKVEQRIISANMENAINELTDCLEAIYDNRFKYVSIYSESDNFITRLLEQSCYKNKIKCTVEEVKC